MTAHEKLDHALKTSLLTQAQQATVLFAVGVISTLEHPLIEAAEKSMGTPYRASAREMMPPGNSLN